MSNVKIATTSRQYRYFTFEYFLRTLRELEIRYCELWLGTPHILMEEMDAAAARALKKKLADNGVVAEGLTYPSMIYPYQFAGLSEYRERALAMYTRCLEMASEMECPVFALNSGWGLIDEPREDAWARSREMLAALAERAGELGVLLTLECMRKDEETNLVHNLENCARMLREVNSPHLKPMADTGGISWAGETLKQWIDEFGKDIAYMHFVDAHETDTHLVWGTGNLPLADMVKQIDEVGYTGALVLEMEVGTFRDPRAADEQNMRVLREAFGC